MPEPLIDEAANSSGGIARWYHERTKHHFGRYARSLGYMDWATQPDPFRRYEDAPLIALPFHGTRGGPAYDDLYTSGAVAPARMDIESIASLFEFSLGLSAWKQYQGSRWALRVNPSSGNLHPTEGYLVCGAMEGPGDRAGVYHYAPKEHALERRAAFDEAMFRSFAPDANVLVLVGLTSIHWREAWKYGERAYRYCQEDVGHALAAVAMAAAVCGWHAAILNKVTDNDISVLLGLNRDGDFSEAEREEPDLLMAISTRREVVETMRERGIGREDLQAFAGSATWTGSANRLSRKHVPWEAIDAVAQGCHKSDTVVGEAAGLDDVAALAGAKRNNSDAITIIRQRRSAVAFDGRTGMAAESFFSMLARVMPSWSCPPLAALGAPVCIHLAIFVHRVAGLTAGLYALPRTTGGSALLRKEMSPSFSWKKPENCPQSLPLYLLESGDVRALATQVSCGQEIAGDSAFSLGFLAEFAEPLRRYGDWIYRRLHWEAGAIAQILYLEAEAVGLRATGMGCYFDDPVHDVFGISGNVLQSLYHFTLGGPVEDSRLTTLPPYEPAVVAARVRG